jgi:antitoxin (DNA-binding transcriptional repressor) of toxin-antitoxin stability system
MRSVGLKVLKNKLSEYVRIAAGGETVLVTDRDRVVAESCATGAAPAARRCTVTEAVRGDCSRPPRGGNRAAQAHHGLRDLMNALQRDREDR